MQIGQSVYFRDEGVLKIGIVEKDFGPDDVIIVCEGISYRKHYWEIRKVPYKE
jgi:hypothetical protein